jgi:PIN domain nuclease of toxin-antitoxin system
MLNLDTHIVVHAFAGNATASERRMLEKSPWGMSAIVLWELEMLYRLKRISDDPQRGAFAAALSRIEIFAITPDVVAALRELDFRSDPANEVIAATSIALHIPLVTRDKNIRSSKIVPFAK